MSEEQESKRVDSQPKPAARSVAGKERVVLWLLVVGLMGLALWQHLRIVRLENAVVEMLGRSVPAATAGNADAVRERASALREDAMSRIPAGKKRPVGAGVAGGVGSAYTKELPTGKTHLAGKKLEREMAETLGCDRATAGEVLEILSRETKRRRALQVELEKGYIPEEHFVSEVKALRSETDKQVVSRLDEAQAARYMEMREL